MTKSLAKITLSILLWIPGLGWAQDEPQKIIQSLCDQKYYLDTYTLQSETLRILSEGRAQGKNETLFDNHPGLPNATILPEDKILEDYASNMARLEDQRDECRRSMDQN